LTAINIPAGNERESIHDAGHSVWGHKAVADVWRMGPVYKMHLQQEAQAT
jgi:hypothetical protein